MSVSFPVRQQIQLILKQSYSSKMYRRIATGEELEGEQVSNSKEGRRWRGAARLVREPGEFELISPEIRLLRQLFASVSPEDQRAFADALYGELNASNAPIVAYMVHELGSRLTFRYWERIDLPSIEFWVGIADKLSVEPWLFSPADLDELRVGWARLKSLTDFAIERPDEDVERWDIAKQFRRVLDYVEHVLDLVARRRLEQTLATAPDLTVQADTQRLLSRLDRLKFNKALAETLDEIDRRDAVAATPFDFKSAADLLRSFFEEFFKEAARTIAKTNQVPAPVAGAKGVTHFRSFKDYLQQHGVIDADETQFLQQLYALLSNASAHRLGAPPELFRATKVTVIEWCLVIAGRVAVMAGTDAS